MEYRVTKEIRDRLKLPKTAAFAVEDLDNPGWMVLVDRKGRELGQKVEQARIEPKKFNPNRWGPLHDYRIPWYAAGRFIVQNLTTGDRSPGAFKSKGAAWDWLVRITCRGEDPFDGTVDALALIPRPGKSISTASYGNKRFKNRMRSTAHAATELTRLQALGLVRPRHAKGGVKAWTLTNHGKCVMDLYERWKRSKNAVRVRH